MSYVISICVVVVVVTGVCNGGEYGRLLFVHFQIFFMKICVICTFLVQIIVYMIQKVLLAIVKTMGLVTGRMIKLLFVHLCS